MRVLLLSPYPPYPPHGGGTMRIYQLLRGLSARHDVTCLTFAADDAAEHALAPLHDVCRVLVVRGPARRTLARRAVSTLASPLPDMALRNAAPEYAAALANLLAAESFDVIQAESIEMAGYLDQAPAARSHATLVLDQFNAEFVLQRRAFLADVRTPRRWHAAAYSLAQWRKLRGYERAVMGRCNAVIAVSDDDRRTLERLAPKTTIGVVPNGVDTAVFRPDAVPPLWYARPTLAFTGTLDFRPNVDAVRWFAEHALPLVQARRPDAELVVVGKRPAPALHALADAGLIRLIGEVPDTRPFLLGATACVIPMRIGGGVRLKLLEALALEVPVVSTGMGAEGVAGLHNGEHCLLADTPQDFADAVLRLLNDTALRKRLGTAGRRLAQAGYDWQTIVPRLEQVWQAAATGQ